MPNGIAGLHVIKQQLFEMDKEQIDKCLGIATSIPGLGTAGGSGLLAVLFSEYFGTVDQVAVNALSEIPELPEAPQISKMNPESLRLTDGKVLVRIMRRKTEELNRTFATTEWTPRKVDKVLWTCGR